MFFLSEASYLRADGSTAFAGDACPDFCIRPVINTRFFHGVNRPTVKAERFAEIKRAPVQRRTTVKLPSFACTMPATLLS